MWILLLSIEKRFFFHEKDRDKGKCILKYSYKYNNMIIASKNNKNTNWTNSHPCVEINIYSPHLHTFIFLCLTSFCFTLLTPVVQFISQICWITKFLAFPFRFISKLCFLKWTKILLWELLVVFSPLCIHYSQPHFSSGFLTWIDTNVLFFSMKDKMCSFCLN